jgi:hypothetical protein
MRKRNARSTLIDVQWVFAALIDGAIISDRNIGRQAVVLLRLKQNDSNRLMVNQLK